MNFLAHGRNYLADPLRLFGTAFPDLARIANRRARIREGDETALREHSDPDMRAVGEGITIHLLENKWFHASTAFQSTQSEITAILRKRFAEETGFRASVVSHLALELLLDDILIQQRPARVADFYRSLELVPDSLRAQCLQYVVPQIADTFDAVFQRFLRSRFLEDYADPSKLTQRMNGIIGRAGMDELPEGFSEVWQELRWLVESESETLLTMPDA